MGDVIRVAGVDDVGLLWELEKEASSAALRHVFAADIPFPDDDVLARWTFVIQEPGMTVLIDQENGTPVGYAAFGDQWLRHFGFAPRCWGTGRAQRLHAEVLTRSAALGSPTSYLWVLVANGRARGFYERLGWRDGGVRDTEVFAPYPVKMQMVRSSGG